jgi:MFS family permease
MAVLARIGGPDFARCEVAQIQATLVNEVGRVDFRELFDPRMRTILTLGVVLAVLQQWCGINVIFYYADKVFLAAGYKVNEILLNIVILGGVNMAFTFVAIFTVDRVGRRVLMLLGELGLAVLFAMLGAAYFFHTKGTPVLALVFAAMACYCCTLAPVTWVILSEIFPNRIRGAAMSVSVFALWVANFLLTQSFPIFHAKIGSAFTFWIYSVICTLGFFFILLRLPETKGKTLEQIEQELVD